MNKNSVGVDIYKKRFEYTVPILHMSNFNFENLGKFRFAGSETITIQ
jgi:hypothetical protein